jgi:hypothetical protein
VARDLSRAWCGVKSTFWCNLGSLSPGGIAARKARWPRLQKRRGSESVRRYSDVQSERYLKESASSSEPETPLERGEDEEYLRHKGGPALRAVANRLGKERFEQVLHGFIGKEPREATGGQLAEVLIQVAPQAKRALVAELLQSTSLFDFRVRPQDYRLGRLIVEIEVHHFRITEKGERVEAPFAGDVEVALWTEESTSHRLGAATIVSVPVSSGVKRVEIPTSRKPNFVELDPHRQFFDRSRADNSSVMK